MRRRFCIPWARTSTRWAESLPPQVQNTLADLEGFVLGPLFLGILIGAILFAEVDVAVQQLLEAVWTLRETSCRI